MDSNTTTSEPNQLKNTFVDKWGEALKSSSLIEYKQGQVLFYQDHFPYGAFIILSGEVNLVRKQKGTKDVMRAPSSMPIGIDFIYDGSVYPYSAIAKTRCQACFIPKSVLSDMTD